MKKTPTLIAACLTALAFNMHAQTIESSWMPQAGSSQQLVYFGQLSGLSAGSAGQGQSWDFSSLSGGLELNSNYIAPSSGAGSSNFPSASLALQGDVATTYYGGGSSYSLLGQYGSSSSMIYSNAMDFLRFPVGFGQQFTDDYSATITATGLANPYTRNGSNEVSVDASGSLTTPFGTFDNVLRVRSVDSYQFVGLPPTPGGSTSGTITSYSFISPDYPGIMLMQFSVTNTGSVTDTSITFENPGSVGIREHAALKTMRVYPNPASEYIRVASPDRVKAVEIHDRSGRSVAMVEVKKPVGEIRIDTRDIPAGNYFVSILDGNNTRQYQQVSIIH